MAGLHALFCERREDRPPEHAAGDQEDLDVRTTWIAVLALAAL